MVQGIKRHISSTVVFRLNIVHISCYQPGYDTIHFFNYNISVELSPLKSSPKVYLYQRIALPSIWKFTSQLPMTRHIIRSLPVDTIPCSDIFHMKNIPNASTVYTMMVLFFRFPWPVPVDLHNTQPKDVFTIVCTTIRKKPNARLQTKLKQLWRVCSFNMYGLHDR